MWTVLRGQNGQGMGGVKPAKLSQSPFLAFLNLKSQIMSLAF